MPRKPTTVTIPRVDPDEDFSDVDGDYRTEFALDDETQDPTRHYHWAHKSPDDIGQYKGGVLGYRLEHYAKGGVRPLMCADETEGEAITKRDHVLVSCDRALWEKRERFLSKKTKEANERMFKAAQRPITVVATR